MNKEKLLENLTSDITPLIVELGYEIYHIEFKKESNVYILRVYIDNDGTISLNDCEKVSRILSTYLDEKDPIEDVYTLEVSSPGMERELFNEYHLKKHIGIKIKIKLKNPTNGKKVYIGILEFFDTNTIVVKDEDNSIKLLRNNIVKINKYGDF
ncbi:MAG: ribosome maturation factor RimP [Clostridiaceae bacterium]